jgi:hypothetical protein
VGVLLSCGSGGQPEPQVAVVTRPNVELFGSVVVVWSVVVVVAFAPSVVAVPVSSVVVVAQGGSSVVMLTLTAVSLA